MVFNLDSSVSNDDLRQIFGIYGEIKEVCCLLYSVLTEQMCETLQITLLLLMAYRSGKLHTSGITNSLNFLMLELQKLLFVH